MIDLVHIERPHDAGITKWTSWTWTNEHEYEHEHESLNDMDKLLREVCTWNYLRKQYMVIIWAWQGYGGMIVLRIWFMQEYLCSIINLIIKMMRHGANMGKLIVKTEKVYFEHP